MGLLGKLARRSAVAALRGGGRLVARHVVPDSMSPWQIRKKTSRTSSTIFNLAKLELKRRKQKRKAAEKAEKQAQKALMQNSRASARRPKLSTRDLQPDAWRPAWMQSPVPVPAHARPAARARAASPRAAGPKVLPAGRYDQQMSPAQQLLMSGPPSVRRRGSRASATAAPASKSASMTIRPRVADEPRWDKNAWNRGDAFRSRGGFDDVRSGADIVRSKRLARNRRASKSNKRATARRESLSSHRRISDAAARIRDRYGVLVY